MLWNVYERDAKYAKKLENTCGLFESIKSGWREILTLRGLGMCSASGLKQLDVFWPSLSGVDREI